MAATTTMETVTSADGTPIAFERTGRGPPLVLVHGSTADHTRWDGVAPAFAARHAVYAMDRRGRGQSGDAPGYDLQREVEDIVALVESIGGPVTLLGHSHGAICSLEAALRTDLVGLVLYEPALPVSEADPDTEAVLTEMAALVEAGEQEAALVRFFRDVVGSSPTELDAYRAAPTWSARVAAVHTSLREERARKAYAFDAGRFAELRTPTLLLTGSESAPFLGEATAALDEALPNSRVVVLEGQGHAGMDTAPDRFAEEVLAFVEASTEPVDG